MTDAPGPPAADDGLEPETPIDSDPETTPGDERESRRRRNIIIGAAVAVALVAGVIAAVLLAPSDATGYSDDVEANFMAACTADGGDDVEPVCACLYTEIVDTIPYDRFEEVNDALETAQAADPEAEVRLPADFDEIRAACVEEEGPVVTVEPSPTDETDSSTTSVASADTTTTIAPSDSPIITSDAPNAAVPGGVRPTEPPRGPVPPNQPASSPYVPPPDAPPETEPADATIPDAAPPP